MATIPLVIIILCLLLSALFSGMEIAFLSADKFRIELDKKQGSYSAKILSTFYKGPSKFIITLLVGNNITIVIYGIFMALVLEPVIVDWFSFMDDSVMVVLIMQTTISTIVVLIFGEFLPKSISLINPNAILQAFSIPLMAIAFLLYPIVQTINFISKIIIQKILRSEYSEDQPVFGLTDLNNFLKRHITSTDTDNNVEVSTKIFNNALEFKKIRVRECMIPRTDIVAIDIEDGMPALKNAFFDSGHTKIVIFKESIDDIIGFCHALALYKKPTEIEDILSPILIVPETMLASELLIQFTAERKSIALVVDEFGGTAGLVTIEDVIEQILGEIQDEHDAEDWIEERIDFNKFLLSARHEIDYLNENYKWNIPEGDYETLGGFILAITENIPTLGEVIISPPFTFTIMGMNDARIDTVKVTIDDNSLKED
ncbi:hemolysin family protein [Fulvivirgaceae bacterium LMO-SS25]